MQTGSLFASRDLSTIIAASPAGLVHRFQDYAGALAQYGLEPRQGRSEPLVIGDGVELVISGSTPCELLCCRLKTDDVDEFKSWIGLADDLIRSGVSMPPAQFPQGPYSDRLAGPLEGLTDAEWKDVQLATNYYLFGQSSLVAAYKPAIVRHYAPFEAALYAAERIEIMAGGALTITGYPAILIVKDLIIHEGGKIQAYAATRMTADNLLKLDQ